jgi:hypothetical protein
VGEGKEESMRMLGPQNVTDIPSCTRYRAQFRQMFCLFEESMLVLDDGQDKDFPFRDGLF